MRENMCGKCDKFEHCKKPCDSVEELLDKLNKYSLKSNYLVKFIDPHIIEEICSTNAVVTKNMYTDNFQKTKRKLMACLKQLNRKQRTCLILYYGFFGNDRHNQCTIAKKLKMSQNNVKYTLKRGYSLLRNMITI